MLDFGLKNGVHFSPSSKVQYAQAFPGWTTTVAGAGLSTPASYALYNNMFLDSAGISILDHNWTDVSWLPVIQGNYTAVLQSGFGDGTNGLAPADIRLSQTGLVPLGTHSVQFRAYKAFDERGAFVVTLGGQTLSLTSLGNGANYTLYGADVGAFAGQTVPLTFTVFAAKPHLNDEHLALDDIRFATQIVPEPSTLSLFTTCVLFLCWWIKRPDKSLPATRDDGSGFASQLTPVGSSRLCSHP